MRSASVGRTVLVGFAGGAVVAGARLVPRFRRDLDAAWARLDATDRQTIATPFGPLEYAEAGSGEPLLISHGIFHGCDGALMSVRDIIAGHRFVAPSRFGYLGSSLPAGATPADQADAFLTLLDHLRINRTDVIGISAGATAALQLALRHPDRVTHLVIMSGNLPGNPTAVAPPRWARLVYADLPMWLLKVLARPVLARLMGVPRGFRCSAEDDRVVSDLIDSVFPVAPRVAGITFDAFVSNPDVNSYPLEQIRVPTLLVHAKDDPLTSYDAAQRAADRIPGAVLLTIESGGHLGLGQTERIRSEIATFLTTEVAA